MCGISAALGLSSQPTDVDVLTMIKLSEHRGPDGFGLCLFDTAHGVVETSTKRKLEDISARGSSAAVILGHSRLSIIDVSDLSDQPFLSDTRNSALVFNGEIYNYRELRETLITNGHTFSSTGDTEVLLNSLEEWGPSAVQRLRGMYAFVYVDATSQRLIAARDRYGIKPLYEWRAPTGVVYYASEIKQFVNLPEWDPVVNDHVLSEFLATGVTNFSDETFFQDVREIEPGECIIWDLSATEPTREVARYQAINSQVSIEFDDVLSASVDLHLRSDVEVGACLSGGMDSTALVAIASEAMTAGGRTETIRVFTASSSNEHIDESNHARKVAECLALRHTITRPDDERFWSDLPQIVWHQDEPFASASIVAQWSVFREVHDSGIKVVLDGQGADELLGGYDDYLAARVLDLISSRSFKEARTLLRVYSERGRVDVLRLLRYRVACSRVVRSHYFLWFLSWAQPKLVRLLEARLGNESEKVVSPVPRHQRGESYFDELRRHQLRFSLRMLLKFEDRNSMAMSVESRVPFVDEAVVACATALPADRLISNESTKNVLYESLRKRLSADCWSRTDKIGFAVSQGRWIEFHHEEITVAIADLAMRMTCLDRQEASKIARELVESKHHQALVWRLFVTSLWLDKFHVRFESEVRPPK